jgi:hypothetical protein
MGSRSQAAGVRGGSAAAVGTPATGPVLVLPVLSDVTPASVGELLRVVSSPAALLDVALQVEAMSALGKLLSLDGLPDPVRRSRCIAAGLCMEWLRCVYEAYALRSDVVKRVTFLLRRIVRGAPDNKAFMAAVPLLRSAMDRHPDNAEVARNCVVCLRNLAVHADNRLRLMAVVPLMRAVVGCHLGDATVASNCAGFFMNLADHVDNRVPLMEVVPLLRSAMGHHHDSAEVARTCAGCFWSLASHADNTSRLMAVVPLLRTAMDRHPADAVLAQMCAGCFWKLAEHTKNRVPLMAAVPQLRAALVRHAAYADTATNVRGALARLRSPFDELLGDAVAGHGGEMVSVSSFAHKVRLAFTFRMGRAGVVLIEMHFAPIPYAAPGRLFFRALVRAQAVALRTFGIGYGKCFDWNMLWDAGFGCVVPASSPPPPPTHTRRCPPSRTFTRTLVRFYDDLRASKPDGLEIVFVSCDRDQASFDGYFGELCSEFVRSAAGPLRLTSPFCTPRTGLRNLLPCKRLTGCVL